MDGGAINWNRNQPIIHFLRHWMPFYFPFIRGRGLHDSGVGGFNSANREGHDGVIRGPGAHKEGRAADIYIRAFRPNERSVGDGLFKIFMTHSRELGVESVTWNRQIWTNDARGGPRPFGGDPHTEHIHVAFTHEGSQRQPEILRVYLEELAIKLDTFTPSINLERD